MKKLFVIFLSALIVLSLVGCGEQTTVSINTEKTDTLSGTTFGKSALVEIGDYLWYDATTRIVYWWNGCLTNYRSDTTPSPYYAPNGFPYRYNPETNTFEEIVKE